MAQDRILYLKGDELGEVKKLYESVMTVASHGLFFRTGQIIGARIAKEAKGMEGEFDRNVMLLLKKEGWVEDISFSGNTVKIKGSIEYSKNADTKTCHMLRGVLSKVFEARHSKKIYCVEESCQSEGNDCCIFLIEFRD